MSRNPVLDDGIRNLLGSIGLRWVHHKQPRPIRQNLVVDFSPLVKKLHANPGPPMTDIGEPLTTSLLQPSTNSIRSQVAQDLSLGFGADHERHTYSCARHRNEKASPNFGRPLNEVDL